MGAESSGAYNPEPVLAVLPELRSRGDQLRRRGWIEALAAYLAGQVFTFGLYFDVLHPVWPAAGPLLFSLGAFAAGLAMVHWGGLAMSAQIRARLSTSGIFECLVYNRPGDYEPLAKLIADGNTGMWKWNEPEPAGLTRLVAANMMDLLYPERKNTQSLDAGCIGLLVLILICVVGHNLWLELTYQPGNTGFGLGLLTIVQSATLGIIGMIALFRHRGAWLHNLLSEYIEEQLAARRAGETERTRTDISLHQMVNDLESAFNEGNLTLLGNAVLLNLLPVCCWFLGCAYLAVTRFSANLASAWFWACLLLVTGICTMAIPWLVALRQARGDARLLETSSLVSWILSGESDTLDIRRSTPALLRWNLNIPRMPARYGKGVIERFWLAGYNLDWFLNPGWTLVRPAWFVGPAQFCVTLATLVCIPLFDIFGPVVGLAVAIPLAAIICTGIYTQFVIRRQIWTGLLIQHLRKLIG